MVGFIATVVVIATAVAMGVRLAGFFDVTVHRAVAFTLTVALALGVAFVVPAPVHWMYLAWLAVQVLGWTALSMTDAYRHEIPDLISFPFLILGIVYQAVLGVPLAPTLVAIAALFGLSILIGLVGKRWREAVGGGDVVLLGITLAWLGLTGVVDVIVLGCFLLIPQIAHQIVTDGEGRFPLAPALGLATVAVWITGPLF